METHITREIMLTDYDFCESTKPIVTVKPEFNQVLIRFGGDGKDVEIANGDNMLEAVETLGSHVALLRAAIDELRIYREQNPETTDEKQEQAQA